MNNYKVRFFKKVVLNFIPIIKSFFISNPEFQKERLSICNSCEYNSKNRKKLTKEEEFYIKINNYEDTCLACGCGIKRKTKIKEEDCGLTELNKKPKWEKII